jgi:general secretion pathway protein D
VLEYSKAIQLDPNNVQYKASLERARLRASEEHARSGRLLAARGLYKEASDEFRLGLDLNPGSPTLPGRDRERGGAAARAGTRAPTVEDDEAAHPGAGLSPALSWAPRRKAPLGLSFRDASLREAYLALGRVSSVNFVFDPQFQDQTITLDLRDVPFDEALSASGASARPSIGSWIPTSSRSSRTRPPSAASTSSRSSRRSSSRMPTSRRPSTCCASVLGARRVAPVPGGQRPHDQRRTGARRGRRADRRRHRQEAREVVVDVEILEVNRGRLKEYGIEITSNVRAPKASPAASFPNPLGVTTLDENPYRKSNLVVSNLPGVIYRLLQSDTSTRILANPQLRASEGQTAQARFGDQVPVPVTTFSPIASGGVAQQPITSFEYKDVGVNIDITPRVHHDDEVSLNAQDRHLVRRAGGVPGLPTFNSRTVNTIIRSRTARRTSSPA